MLFVSAIFIGALTKDSVIVLIPAVAFSFLAGREKKFALITVLSIAVFALAFFGIRFLIGFDAFSKWSPSFDRFFYNMRWRALATTLLTLGLVGLLFIKYLFSIKNDRFFSREFLYFTFGGLFGTAAFIVVSTFIAHLDARFS
jgi:hypothetical protein